MNFSSLNAGVLLYLMGFVTPVDRFNMVLSGVLKGFENVNEGVDLRERIDVFEIELGLRRGGKCELEIRSLRVELLRCDFQKTESLFKILERLAENGYLRNNQQLESICFHRSSFVKVICSMKNLEKLTLRTELPVKDLAHVFQSCTNLIELNTIGSRFEMAGMDEDLINQLRAGFQKLRCFNIDCFIVNDTWPGIQLMLSWLKECVKLTIYNINEEDDDDLTGQITDGSLFKTLDPNLAKSLEYLNLTNVPVALTKWILSTCVNIHHLQIEFLEKPNGFLKSIARLKNLKKLDVAADRARDLKGIVRSCRQVRTLRMNINRLTVRDLAELEPAENTTDITLRWEKGPSVKEVLPLLKRWRHLCRLTFTGLAEKKSVPPFEELGDFILGMEHLSHFHISPAYDCTNVGQLKILRDKVTEFILPLRPNFKFDVSHMCV